RRDRDDAADGEDDVAVGLADGVAERAGPALAEIGDDVNFAAAAAGGGGAETLCAGECRDGAREPDNAPQGQHQDADAASGGGEPGRSHGCDEGVGVRRATAPEAAAEENPMGASNARSTCARMPNIRSV